MNLHSLPCLRSHRLGFLASASLAVAGLIGPLLAAVLMPLSSITVVTLSYRSRMFRGADS